MFDEDYDPNWVKLYHAIQAVLQPIAAESPFTNPRGDYFLVDDDWGCRGHKIEISNLALLEPTIIQTLRKLLDDYPDWDILIAVDRSAFGGTWPPMGIRIRKHEIIDGLKREYFPPEYRGFQYEDARPGTEKD